MMPITNTSVKIRSPITYIPGAGWQYITVNGRRITVARAAKMEPAKIISVDARGRTSLTALDLPAAIEVDVSGCTGLTALDIPAATVVNVSGCTGLTTLDIPAATLVDASDCTGLTALYIPAATRIYTSGCTGLTALDIPTATLVDASGCTGLTALVLPAATRIDVSGCTGLIALDLPAAIMVYASNLNSSPVIIPAGADHRGYEFYGLRVSGVWRIAAGCRYFTLPEARKHWESNKECLALVEKIAIEIKARAEAGKK